MKKKIINAIISSMAFLFIYVICGGGISLLFYYLYEGTVDRYTVTMAIAGGLGLATARIIVMAIERMRKRNKHD